MISRFPKNIVQTLGLIAFGFIPSVFLVAIQAMDLVHIPEQIFNSTLFVALSLSIIFFYVWKNKRIFTFKDLFAYNNPKRIKLLFFFLLIMIIFQLGVETPISRFISFHVKKSSNISNPFNNLPAMIGAVTLAPFFEEIIFRGIILRGFLSNYKPAVAIIISTTIFALAHGAPNLIFGTFFLGLLFSYLFYLTKSIIPTMFFHSISNVIGLSIGFLLFKNYNQCRVEKTYGDYTIAILCISLITVVFFGWLLLKKNRATGIK
ncbi:CPBP family intramembrane metalloprotease [Pedobacter changchengzhani]|uniref:CPBP family intramembrane metalloprotease n=1 Tax=Pedobacter changchengzhani TaxID=2529274 RepID=A0A4R5MN57_9SPHI|nr:type II CAAX endopeptidase family protein [Pedobacter changchengzhani]TDG37172.1 CPBP family intramembrane metalloprotease [Pedobacter changchengzhani]